MKKPFQSKRWREAPKGIKVKRDKPLDDKSKKEWSKTMNKFLKTFDEQKKHSD
ncbi:MAG TPA: hypothetical protein H9958_04790 [Candidatus Limosilactobacillus intestinavium]|nr:hypothetical protein [Candidatus Limosilactobacillus intestinavium]